jgi:hypothetical protein
MAWQKFADVDPRRKERNPQINIILQLHGKLLFLFPLLGFAH